jgi:hypothetical protein
MVNVNWMAHIQLNVSDMSRSAPFYKKLLNAMSLQTIVDSDEFEKRTVPAVPRWPTSRLFSGALP